MKEIKQYPLGRNPSPFDARDYNLRHFIPFKTEQEAITEKKWEFSGESLNQGDFGHCFPVGTLIRMADGSSKTIENINLLDNVLTAECNSKMVLKTMVRQYSGEMLTIGAWGNKHLECTPEHPILTKRGYISAKDLTDTDFIAIPRLKYEENNEDYLYFTNIVDLNNARTKDVDGYISNIGSVESIIAPPKNEIKKTYELGWLFGIYLAEGWRSKSGGISLAFHIDEENTIVKKTVDLFKSELGIDSRLQFRTSNKTIIVKIAGRLWGEFFSTLCGVGANGKYIHAALYGNTNFRRGILDGWIAGDGYSRRASTLGITVSKQLAHDMYCIANDLGLLPTINVSEPSMNKLAKTRQMRWCVEWGVSGEKEIYHNTAKWRREIDSKYTWRKINFIFKKYVENIYVYNLEVEGDNSYCAEGIGVHNCVGFSGASWGINLPVNTLFTNEDGHRMYYECKIIEGEPEQENGAYVRSIAKVLKNNGRLEAYAFAPDMATIRWWLLNKGPVIAGTIWTQSMFTPDENNIITIDANVVGGHAYLLNEWREDGYIGIQNSWGKDWGDNGKAYIHYLDFEKIFKYGGEAMAAVELAGETPVEQPKKCWLWELIKQIFKI